jgi:hypothetical protein
VLGAPGSTLRLGMSPSNLFSNTELPKLLVQQWDDWHNRLHMLLMQIRAEAYREEVVTVMALEMLSRPSSIMGLILVEREG